MSDTSPQLLATPALSSPPVDDANRQLTAAAPRLRLWPAVAVIAALWLVMELSVWLAPNTRLHFFSWFLGPMVATFLLTIWWLFASRLPWRDRWLGLGIFVGSAATTQLLTDSSLTFFVLIVNILPVVITALVVWLAVTSGLRWPFRRVGLLAVDLLAWGFWLFLCYDGVDGSLSASFRYRWGTKPEDRFLAEMTAGNLATAAPPAVAMVLQESDWPGFRGPNRDGRRPGVRIATSWNDQPPRLVWRHRVGPGWSSFAVVGNCLFTQEQRGPEEVVVCYDAGSGAELWVHRDPIRFNEVMAGPGPRATPTFHEGRIYAQGAAGRLNCLDAATGRVLWWRDILTDAGARLPMWGYAGSPLVSQGVVAVFAGGPDGKSVLGYKASSGELAWSAGEGQYSYCSPQPARLSGVEQIVISTEQGLTAFRPADGVVLWQHSWPLDGGMARVVQPARVGDADFLLGTGFGKGTQRVHVHGAGSTWETDSVWTTLAIKPYYNDMVIHQGHLYGFDNDLLACVSLDKGERQWKERGYGNGQVLLLADQDLLLVLSEKGEAALVEARPAERKELGRFKAITGKTWNHPVVAHGRLFVRNGEEAACYELLEMPAGGN